MKKVTTTNAAVTANLATLFPAKNGVCTEIFDNGLTESIIVEFPAYGVELLIQDKKVFRSASIQKLEEYTAFCSEHNKANVQKRIGSTIYIPFVWDKKTATKPHLEQEKKILICCSLAKPKSEVLKPEQFIRKHAGKSYADIYKVIAELSKQQELTAKFERKMPLSRYGKNEMLFLIVNHKTGFYSFPVDHIADTCTDNEIISNYLDLFKPANIENNPLIVVEKPQLSTTMVISREGKLKMKNLCNRLKRNYAIAA